jgi:hypothetical protein
VSRSATRKVTLRLSRNLYSDFARAVVARLCHKSHDEIERPFPTVEDGVKGLAFVEAAVRSSASRRWEVLGSSAV